MRTISPDQFVEFMTDALPELLSLIMREDDSAVSQGRVSVPQFWALHYIAARGPLTVNELAKALHRCKSSVSGLVSRLCRCGLATARRSVTDRRVVHVALTAKGARLISELAASRKEGVRKTYAALTGNERSLYRSMMEKILVAGRKTVVMMVLLAGAAASGEAPKSYTIDESIRIGLQRSLAVANAARQRQIADTTRTRALAEALPQLNGIADYSLYDADNLTDAGTRSYGAEATWQIFSGGKTLSGLRAAKTYRQLTADQERRIQETQARDIAYSYHEVQLAKAQADVRGQSVLRLEDFARETKSKFDAGTASEFDWLSATVSLANEKPKQIAAQNRLTLAKERFRNLTYIDDGEFDLSDPLVYTPLRVDLDEAIALGLKKRPELREKAGSIALRKEDITQQRSDYYPKVNLFAGYNYYNPDPYSFLPGSSAEGWQPHWSAGVRAQWSLFDGGTRRANVGESKLNMAIEEDQYNDLVRAVSLEIRSQWLRGRDSAEVISATAESVTLAERALTIARARFDAGLGTNLEVTQANLELSDARLARFAALYEYMNAVAGMKYAVGILLEEYEK